MVSPEIRESLEAAPSATAATAAGPTHIVWQNIRTGLRVFWHMNRTQWEGSENELWTIPTEWDIVASADFTGDGQSDLVWQRRSTGDQVIWHMDGF